MAIGAFFWRDAWYRPSIRPAGPAKMTSGMGLLETERNGTLLPQQRLTEAQDARKYLELF